MLFWNKLIEYKEIPEKNPEFPEIWHKSPEIPELSKWLGIAISNYGSPIGVTLCSHKLRYVMFPNWLGAEAGDVTSVASDAGSQCVWYLSIDFDRSSSALLKSVVYYACEVSFSENLMIY